MNRVGKGGRRGPRNGNYSNLGVLMLGAERGWLMATSQEVGWLEFLMKNVKSCEIAGRKLFLGKIWLREKNYNDGRKNLKKGLWRVDVSCRSTWINEEPWGFWSNFGHSKKTARCLIKFYNSHCNPVLSWLLHDFSGDLRPIEAHEQEMRVHNKRMNLIVVSHQKIP